MTGRFVDYSPIPTCQVFFPGRGGFAFSHFALPWSWGNGKKLSYNDRDRSCWNLCDYGGRIQGIHLIAHNHVSQIRKVNPSLICVSFCACFVVICGCLYESNWYRWDVVECEVNLVFWYERKPGVSLFW